MARHASGPSRFSSRFGLYRKPGQPELRQFRPRRAGRGTSDRLRQFLKQIHVLDQEIADNVADIAAFFCAIRPRRFFSWPSR